MAIWRGGLRSCYRAQAASSYSYSYGSLLLYIKRGVRYRLRILGGVTYVLVVARTGTPTVPTALGVPHIYAPAVTRILGPTIAMSVTILKLYVAHSMPSISYEYLLITIHQLNCIVTTDGLHLPYV